jgi:hypothetical protein
MASPPPGAGEDPVDALARVLEGIRVQVRWITPFNIVTALFLASCAAVAGTGSGNRDEPAGTGSAAVVPLPAFLASVRSANYGDYTGQAGTRARDQQAFEEMRGFVLARYHDARVRRSYAAGGIVFDCIEQSGPATVPPSAAVPPAPAAVPPRSAAVPPGSSAAAQSEPAPCPVGSVPVRRITLGELVRFPTLSDFLGKSPAGPGRLPRAGPPR